MATKAAQKYLKNKDPKKTSTKGKIKCLVSGSNLGLTKSKIDVGVKRNVVDKNTAKRRK
jgi:ribosomal protein S20